MKNEKLTMIDVKDIYPHPDNPRKNVGDVTELSDSIKKNGIMQNLTVIPGHYENGELVNGGYTLIIGHRRCAAAKESGVTMVPCRIVEDMDKKEQVSTMLEENMQRNDLTVFEQAQGFQMMLDLGETEETISEKTGFSKTTVRHRLNIAKLDQNVIKEKTDTDGFFQLTLKDLYELEKIENIEERNRVLKESHDSRDLVWRAKQAAEDEKLNKNMEIYEKLFHQSGIKKAPKKVENEMYSGKWDVLQEFDLNKEAPEKIKEFKRKDVAWLKYSRYSIKIVAPRNQKERKKSQWEIKREETERNKKELKKKTKELFKKLDRFIKCILDGEIDPVKKDINYYKMLVSTIEKSQPFFGDAELLLTYGKNVGLWSFEHDDPEGFEKFVKWKDGLDDVEKILCCLGTVRRMEIVGYNGDYQKEKAEKIESVIDFFRNYGFYLTEDEKKVLDGTHELYMKKEGEE